MKNYKMFATVVGTIFLAMSCGKQQANTGLSQNDDEYYVQQATSQGYLAQSQSIAQQMVAQNQGSGVAPQGNADDALNSVKSAYLNYLSSNNASRGFRSYGQDRFDNSTRWGRYRPRSSGGYVGFHNPNTGAYGIGGVAVSPWGVGFGGVTSSGSAGCWFSFFSMRTTCGTVANTSGPESE